MQGISFVGNMNEITPYLKADNKATGIVFKGAYPALIFSYY